MNTTREALRDYLKIQSWDAFFTATFTPLDEDYESMSTGERVLLRPPVKHSATAIEKVIKALRKPRLRPTKMFVAAEQHMLGGWHCHGLLEFPDTKHHDKMIGFQESNLKRLGYNCVSSVGDLDACSMYLSKYLVKDEWHGDWQTVGRKKFWREHEEEEKAE